MNLFVDAVLPFLILKFQYGATSIANLILAYERHSSFNSNIEQLVLSAIIHKCTNTNLVRLRSVLFVQQQP